MHPLVRYVTLVAVLSAAACHRPATLEVNVLDHGAAVTGVTLTVRSPAGLPLASARTSSLGTIRLADLSPGSVVLEALLLSDRHAGYAARRVELRPGLNRLAFELGRDLVLTPLVRAEELPPRPTATPFAELEADRRVAAVLELDRVEGVHRPRLAVETREGTLRLENILAEVGLDVTTVWSDTIPAVEVGAGWPGEDRLAEVLASHRNAPVPADAWRLHLLLAPQPEPDVELSLVVDPAGRTGAVVFLPPDVSEASALHAVVHEIGHLLNLAHPWEVGADTRSVMSYPWRWPDWQWDDPSVFRFDPAARRHLLRAPERCVRPGAGPFGSCWQRQPPRA